MVVGQLVLEVTTSVDPVAQEGVPVVNVRCGSRELKIRRVTRNRCGNRSGIRAKRFTKLYRNLTALTQNGNHCRGFVVDHHGQRGFGGDNLHAGHAANHGVNRSVIVESVAGQLQHRSGCPGDIGTVLPPLILHIRPDCRIALRRNGKADRRVHRGGQILRLTVDLDARSGGIDIRADVLAGNRLQLVDTDSLLVVDMAPRNHGTVASAALLVDQFCVVAFARDV